MYRTQELDVAVSLSLFVSRMAEMMSRVSTNLAGLPAALTEGAHAASKFSVVCRSAAAATLAGKAAHLLAQDLNVSSSPSNNRILEVSCLFEARFGLFRYPNFGPLDSTVLA